jgi:hypothetical protein
VSLTSSINFHGGEPGDLRAEGTTIISGWKQNVIAFELTFH